MSGTSYATGSRGRFHPDMTEQERHHAKLDFDKAEEAATDFARLEWFEKWGRRVADYVWSNEK